MTNEELIAEMLAVSGVPDMETLMDQLKQYREDVIYLDSLVPELVKEFPDHYVAVYQKKVVGTGKYRKILLRKLEKEGIPRDGVAIEFMATNPILLIV